MEDLKAQFKNSYIQDADTGFIGKVESISEIEGEVNVIRGIFVSDEGKIMKKTIHFSKLEVVERENAEEYFETIIALLNIRANKICEFCHWCNDKN